MFFFKFGVLAISLFSYSKILILVRKMEAEVVRMCINMFNGNEDCCGTVRSCLLLFLDNRIYAVP